LGDLVPLSPGQVKAFGDELHARAERHLSFTLGHLAAGLPIFEVHFTTDSKLRVVEVGHVPGKAADAP
jgi:hypothetical protein